MATKPQNHVTRLRSRVLGELSPQCSPEFLEYWEGAYPERCIGAEETPLEAHRYAGAVALLAAMRASQAADREKTPDELEAEEMEAALAEQDPDPNVL